jgi:pimeloyl-ACP methyl ester carboxylesterase
MPLVIMAGREDKVVKAGGQSRRLHEEVPHSSIRLVPNVGHMLHYAVPEEVVAAIETVFGRVAGAPRAGTTGMKRRRHFPEPTRNTPG